MATSQEIIEIKARADIVGIIGRYIKLKKQGRNWVGLCPFHNEKTPSFSVNPALGIYKCFGCDKGGDIITFIEEIEHLDFGQAIEKLAKETGVSLSRFKKDNKKYKKVLKIRELNNLALKFWQHILFKHKSGKKALTYLKKERKFTEQTIKKFGLGYAPASSSLFLNFAVKKGYKTDILLAAGLIVFKDQEQALALADKPKAVWSTKLFRDRFIDRVMFPVFDASGNVVAFSGRSIVEKPKSPKYLNSPETDIFKKRFYLFGLYQSGSAIRQKDETILVEGQTDVISSHQVGIENIVAPLGTGLTEYQLSKLGRYGKKVVLAFDNDEAGNKALHRGAILATQEGLVPYILRFPTKFHDIDQLAKKEPKTWQKIAKARKNPYFKLLVRGYQKGKNQEAILRQLLEFIKHTSDAVKKELYLQKVAKELDISKDSLLEMVTEKQITQESKEESTKQAVSTEEYLINLVLQHPRLAFEHPKLVKYFSVDSYSQIYSDISNFFRDFAKDKDEVDETAKEFKKAYKVFVQDILDTLPQIKEIVMSKTISEMEDFSPKDAVLEEDFRQSALRLKKRYLDDKLYQVQAQLDKADSKGDKSLVNQLEAKLNKLEALYRQVTVEGKTP